MSRLLARAGTVAAGVSIVLLVLLLVVLWTGLRPGLVTSDAGAYRDERLASDNNDAPANVREGDRTSTSSKPAARTPSPSPPPPSSSSSSPTLKISPSELSSSSSSSTRKTTIEDESTNHRSEGRGTKTRQNAVERVLLTKINRNIYEDPIDPENAAAIRHHSGHFRHASAEIWDPHPQYEFEAFGRRFHLLLTHDVSFVSPDIRVTHVTDNSTHSEDPGRQLGCFYSGTVDGDPISVVSVSLCHGMSGHIRTSNGSYFIEPADRAKPEKPGVPSKPRLHLIWNSAATKSSTNDVDLPDDVVNDNNCALSDSDYAAIPVPLTDDDASATKIYVGDRHSRSKRSLTRKSVMDKDSEEVDYFHDEHVERFVRHREARPRFRRPDRPYNRYFPTQRRDYAMQRYYEAEVEDPFETWRPRRALPQEYFIELLVVADADMKAYHGEGLLRYILVLMSTVSRIYKDPSIGNPISIAVVKITTTDDIFGDRIPNSNGIDASETLKRFCFWQKHNNTPDETSPMHHDVALLLTRENLCNDPHQMQLCDTLGLAELGQMCVARASCAIVQDNGLAAAFTIAHEIGHVLNMPHDNSEKCDRYRGKKRIHNIMSRMLDDNTFPWEWSNCSRHFLTEFLDVGYGNCLRNKPGQISHLDFQRMPGEDYSENKQCELVFGPGSKICPNMAVCRRLWCVKPMGDGQCHTHHMPWADGTACAHGRWCQRGECVERKTLRPVDGKWGPWGSFTECSRTCGGGIKKKYRECNNPRPQHGGNYCIGPRVKYYNCATEDCPRGTPDFREEQCARFNDDNRGIAGLANDVKWHAKYNRILPKDRCKLFCQTGSNQYYQLRDKVIDGTTCGLDTFHMCVDGRCEPAGCDHVMNSTAELDICGVCQGDNSSCQRIRGSYNSSAYGYSRVTKIPAGSSYIDIRQYGWQGLRNDSNYLALRKGEGGEYILNGQFVVMNRRVIVQSGLTIEYSGPGPEVERLNSSRPIDFDLILEILSIHVEPPQIVYEYTVPKHILNRYTWVLSDWSSCTRICQGIRYRKAECRSTEHKDVVPDDFCPSAEKPAEHSRMCNTDCMLHWQVINVSECSSHCGPGTRMITSQCVQNLSTGSRPIATRACMHLPRPAERESCTGPCDHSHWLYGEWSSCSVTCDGGIQTRTATCVDSSERRVPDSECDAKDKLLKRICGQDVCPKWAVGDWTPCSVSCGIGQRKRPYWCQVETRIVAPNYCSSPLPQSIETCDMGPCYRWTTGDWSACSVTCGGGLAKREVICRNPSGEPTSDCDPAMKPPATRTCSRQSCPIRHRLTTPLPGPHARSSNEDPGQRDNDINGSQFPNSDQTYTWRTGTFGPCSRLCNGGTKTRVVQCSSTDTGSFAPENNCVLNEKPPVVVPCNQHPCPMWNTGDWSQCDSECGFQHRQVRCQSQRGEILPDKDCVAVDKPEHTKRCSTSGSKCSPTKGSGRNTWHNTIVPTTVQSSSYRWRTSRWTPCSKSCGSGTKTRNVGCVKTVPGAEDLSVDERECLRLQRKPKARRPCQRRPCDYTWQETPWSECSATCGNGLQQRIVTCHRSNRFGWIDPAPTTGCREREKPVNRQTCKLRECNDIYYWSAGPWRKCTASCGRKGKQLRRLFCHRHDGKKVARSFCPRQFRPQRKRRCNERRCGPMSCVEAQKRYRSRRDGEYRLIIAGKFMMIYCHKMSGNQPLEYLTLPPGDQNFAEIYRKRLSDPMTCPYNGQRNDSCACIDVISGHTMFQRIRIIPETLLVNVTDFTFSVSNGTPIEFGEAGDCYSLVQCPQGRFSVNLSGTNLRVSPEVTWISQGSASTQVINKINDQKITGRCGGYCGFCKAATGLKLDVLPP